MDKLLQIPFHFISGTHTHTHTHTYTTVPFADVSQWFIITYRQDNLFTISYSHKIHDIVELHICLLMMMIIDDD